MNEEIIISTELLKRLLCNSHNSEADGEIAQPSDFDEYVKSFHPYIQKDTIQPSYSLFFGNTILINFTEIY